jgi:ADP-ribosyl-[dinitrogen reductase] hydrolase
VNDFDVDEAALELQFERYMHLLPGIAEEYPPLPAATWPALDAAARLDRAQGCLLGLAIGEAQAGTGEWAEATAMALCLAQSLAQQLQPAPGLDQYDFMERLQRWMSEGENTVGGACVGIGATTRAAIERFAESDEPAQGLADGASAGNGSLIRLAPVAIACAGQPGLGRMLAVKQSRTTHGTLECLDACELFVAQLIDALDGAEKAQATRPRVMQLSTRSLALAGGEWKGKTREQIRSSAYVVDTLEAALWAVWTTENFRDAVLLARSLGGDATSAVGAVTGQLAGALYGAAALPAEWLSSLSRAGQLRETASGLAA